MNILPCRYGQPRGRFLTGAISLGLLTANSFAYAQSSDSDTIPRLESTECVTEALTELGADCYTFHGHENWDEPGDSRI
ncbi:MAG: hypothetical protein ACQEW0_12025 [Pseudomonadota bacterium]